MVEELEFHVEFLKMRYFKLVEQEWGFQVPVTKEMVLQVFAKNAIDSMTFDFNRNSPQSYTLSFNIEAYSPQQWGVLKQRITEALG